MPQIRHPQYTILVDQEKNLVEMWSKKRMPFEPKGWLLELREDMKKLIKQIIPRKQAILHASYHSKIIESFDLENILFYNIGASCFSAVVREGIRFERVFANAPAVEGTEEFPHYHKYQLQKKQGDFLYWKRGAPKYYFQSITIPKLKPEIVWHSMLTQSEMKVDKSLKKSDKFGLCITLAIPNRMNTNAASVVKPLFDGVIASFHQHNGMDIDEISDRLSMKLDADSKGLKELLLNDASNLLGRRRLLWLRDQGVQWNPRDDDCVAGELLIRKVKVNDYHISGHIFKCE